MNGNARKMSFAILAMTPMRIFSSPDPPLLTCVQRSWRLKAKTLLAIMRRRVRDASAKAPSRGCSNDFMTFHTGQT